MKRCCVAAAVAATAIHNGCCVGGAQSLGGGSGRGRGAGAAVQQPAGVQVAGGLVRKPEKAKNKGKASARGGGRGGGKGGGRGARTATPLGEVVDIVPEDFFFRHQELPKAHTDAVMAIVMVEDAIYTASRDKLLKRWKPARNAAGRFELTADLEVPLGEIAWCLISAGEWLFCGLGNGAIRAYSKSGGDLTLHGSSGHTKRVACLLAHQHVLLSGSADATVRCWLYDAASQNFACTHSVSEGVPGPVACMSVLNDRLWIGGSSGIAIVELSPVLRVVAQVGPKKFVSGLLPFTGHMIVVYSDGCVCIFTAEGQETHSQPPMPAGPVLCLAGLDAGPRVLCGHAKGQVSTIELPTFRLRHCWQTFERCKVQSIATAGPDAVFLVGGENGTLQLWQRDEAAARANGA